MYVCPPALIVAERAGPVFASTVYEIIPLPVPALDVWIQVFCGDALQEQFGPVVICVDPEPAALDKVGLVVGFSEYVHGAAACETVYVFPPTVIVPDRALPPFESMK